MRLASLLALLLVPAEELERGVVAVEHDDPAVAMQRAALTERLHRRVPHWQRQSTKGQ